MGKRKRCDKVITIDSDSPSASEDPGDKPPKQHARRSRITEIQGEEIEGTTLQSPDSEEVKTTPQGQKLTKRLKGKNAASKSTKKLDSLTFDIHFKNMWRSFPEDKKKIITYFDSLWFAIYMKKSSRENMLTWIKDKDIFSKKYVLVPIVCWGHWSLLIFCGFGERLQSENELPCMLLLDSLQMAGPRRLEPAIRKFVLDIYRSGGRPESKQSISRIPLLVPKVPQQRDGEECGNYVLYFINLFVEQVPVEDFSVKKYPYFMTDEWFNLEEFQEFSEKLNAPEK
ncbi:hypothetical protein JCGZ_18074 [Jatropha curcas]|uniref:Ubiquitin-like protease family profile domain-containing protein n=1 Tax=Jatropha curcas TaxID=180498 RepID=A0A067JSH8_JATCU|nr:probable ubiquitin-like-specific protease 2A [Jatropha curcas]KDP26916.1 hypothetical protein JCGZ_18074 [Jatropha curcas]